MRSAAFLEKEIYDLFGEESRSSCRFQEWWSQEDLRIGGLEQLIPDRHFGAY